MFKKSYLIFIIIILFYQFSVAQTSPIAQDDSYSTETNTTLNVGVSGILENDADAEGDSLTVISFSLYGTSYAAGETTSFAQGSITINSNGSFIFVPTEGYFGFVPIIRYIMSDGIFTDSANLKITVIKAPPIAEDNYNTATINTPLIVGVPGVLDNDSDAENDPLIIISFSVNGIVYSAGQTASFAEGSITLNANGSYIFVPTTGYFGNVPTITYTISDGTYTDSANLLLTVERITNILEIEGVSSCNQGYTKDKEYKIEYGITLKNKSTARDYHPESLIENIDLTNNLEAVFGNGCIKQIDVIFIETTKVPDFIDDPYPREFSPSVVNVNYLNTSSNSVFNSNAINNLILYPRQTINIQICIVIDPFCNGRPNPTPSGSGINFKNTFKVNSSAGTDAKNLSLNDFHTSEAIVAAGLYIPEEGSALNSDGTYQFTNTVVITNEGTATAKNINYNMGVGNFLDNNVVFKQTKITQVSGSPIIVNDSYDGDTNTLLLIPNSSLAPGETIILEVFFLTELSIPPKSLTIGISEIKISQTQGILDGYDESTVSNKRKHSFVTWSDSLGDHLDRYYIINSPIETASSTSQCSCNTSIKKFFTSPSSSSTIKTSSIEDQSPNGILEHQEITFQLKVSNTSDILQLENLKLQDNLKNNFNGKIVSVSAPIILNSTATINPVLNNAYNGATDINIFNGITGLLLIKEFVTVQFSVVFSEDSLGINTANFSATNPYGNVIKSLANLNVDASTDTDVDGITNFNDLDDDNDTIPDLHEYNGLNPLDDDDNDLIPNYRDIDFGTDTNSDGIVDLFDFDNDGVPNHFDLDSDNDGILDIVEAENIDLDTDKNGMTNNIVGLNGLDDTLEDNDTFGAIIIYTIPNTDIDNPNNPNFLDIDADGDGIVDNIEAQTTAGYNAPSGTVSLAGVDNAYPNGIDPIDTDDDAVFDYIDLNSDNDIRDDFIEGWDTNNDGTPETVISNVDADNDGLDDAFDKDITLIQPTNGQIPLDFPNIDNPDTSERDWREIISIVVIINNVSEIEGEILEFTISLVSRNDNAISIISTTPIDIIFLTSDGTSTTGIYNIAIAPYDYIEILPSTIPVNTLTIPAGAVTSVFQVTSLEDNINELIELFTLNGTITSNNTINTQISGVGSIRDNDVLPSIDMNSSEEVEGLDLVHTITLSHPSSRPTDLRVTTGDDIAKSPEDYVAISQNLTINRTINPLNSNLTTSFNIPTKLDDLNEPDKETLDVTGFVISANVGTEDLIKTGTIIDIDPDPLLFIEDALVVEGLPLNFIISLLNPDSGLPMRNYLPINFDLESVSQTATIIQDFQMLTVNSTIPAFTFSKTQSVQTVDDELNEVSETMLLEATLTSTGVFNTSAFGTGTIKDNDFPNLFSPNSDGKSDVFRIDGIEDFPNFILIIFDRWGSEVFNYKNNGRPFPTWWDGTNNGKPVIEGVYFYRLNFNDGITPPKTNFIQLIR